MRVRTFLVLVIKKAVDGKQDKKNQNLMKQKKSVASIITKCHTIRMSKNVKNGNRFIFFVVSFLNDSIYTSKLR